MNKKVVLTRTLRNIERDLEIRGMDRSSIFRLVVERLSEIPYYHWSGIYLLEGDELVLETFVGRPTEHVRIPVERGICGSSVASGKNAIVEDVREAENYLACSVETRSEIVVLIRDDDGHILGEIDVDSDDPAAFDREDEQMLEGVARLIVKWFKRAKKEEGVHAGRG